VKLHEIISLAADVAATLFVIGLCIIIEQVSVIERFSLRSRLPGIMMNIAQVPLSLMFAWPLSKCWHSLSIGKLITIPLWSWLGPLGAAGYALQILALLLIVDFLTYWRHRTEHKIFWPIHAVHHSPTELHAANDIGHPMQVWFSLVFIAFPLSLVQIDGPETPVTVSFIVVLLTYYIHSPIDVHFGPLRKILVDNRFHRIHHSLEPRHFDKNFSICFSIWDRLFGTAYDPAPDEWPDVGLEDFEAPRTLPDYLFLPFRKRNGSSKRSADIATAPASGDPCVTALSCATLSLRSSQSG
jgi:sterol desaturase/sphingolipid hydroxylase (fatty acid hydroxylase superfamily)